MTQAIVKAGREDLIPDTKNMMTLADHLLKSGLFPNAKSIPGVVAIMEYGRELGIPPVAALSTMAVVSGRLTMEAKAMLAIAHNNAGVSWKVEKLDDNECTMTFMREGFAPCLVSFTAAEAKVANLLDKQNWRLYRQDMLFARCASRGVRRIAPDAVLGLYSIEEMRDVEAVAKKDMEEGAHPIATPPPEPPKEDVPDGEPEDEEPEEFEDEEPGEKEAPVDEHPEPPEPEVDPGVEGAIADIKLTLKREGVDEHEFKEWLDGTGKKMNRKYVGKIGTVFRFHRGAPADVIYLSTRVSKAIALFRKETGK